jgi:hypothetical protein
MPILSESGFLVPACGERPEKRGLYLELLHGRIDRHQQMNGWGLGGPLIGPLEWCHTTYATHLRVLFKSEADERKYFSDVSFPDAHDIEVQFDLAYVDGVYYGDWSVYFVEDDKIAYPQDTFRDARRRMIE